MEQISFKAIRLQFFSPLHISKGWEEYGGVQDSFIHSDTLKSALFVSGLELGFSPEKMRELFMEKIIFSSAFPFLNGEYFFPKPMMRLPFDFKKNEENKVNKKLKKIGFFGKNYFQSLILGEKIKFKENHLINKGVFFTEVFKNPKLNLYKRAAHTRVTIPQTLQRKKLDEAQSEYAIDAIPFPFERLFFNNDGSNQSGLYVLLPSDIASTDLNIFISILKYLGENGIGCDTTVGNGQFEVLKEEEIHFETSPQASLIMNLSLYCPTGQEVEQIELSSSAYQLIKRGGWLANGANRLTKTYRKKSVFMYKEGGTFKSSIPLVGNVVDLKPSSTEIPVQHEIWRDGRSLFIKIKTDA